MGFPAFHQGRGRPRRWGNSLGLCRPARPAQAEAANLVPIGGTMDQRSCGIARPTNRLDWVSELAPKGRPRLNKRRGRLAQLVRASRLHRDAANGKNLINKGVFTWPPLSATETATDTRAVSSEVERLLYTQDVGGSIPSPPTISPHSTCYAFL